MPFIQEVQYYYQVMDAFVFPSLHEGFGIAAVEAQAAGLLVWISDRVPQEVVVTNRVYTFSLDQQPGEWAEDILKKVSNYQRNIGQSMIDGIDIKEKAMWLQNYYHKAYQKYRKSNC